MILLCGGSSYAEDRKYSMTSPRRGDLFLKRSFHSVQFVLAGALFASSTSVIRLRSVSRSPESL